MITAVIWDHYLLNVAKHASAPRVDNSPETAPSTKNQKNQTISTALVKVIHLVITQKRTR